MRFNVVKLLFSGFILLASAAYADQIFKGEAEVIPSSNGAILDVKQDAAKKLFEILRSQGAEVMGDREDEPSGRQVVNGKSIACGKSWQTQGGKRQESFKCSGVVVGGELVAITPSGL